LFRFGYQRCIAWVLSFFGMTVRVIAALVFAETV